MAMQGSPFGRIKKPLKSDMNVVPYIDVMLVLLVIFMVTAPMITSGITVDLPQAKNSTFESKTPPAIVSIKADGEYLLELGNSNDEAMTLDELKTRLAEAQSEAEQKQQKLMILVNGDKNVAYGKVVGLMSTLQEAGLSQVGLLTDQPKS
ncbi:protein TolR [Alkanindiges illinoisensis]|uniref:protein TolR n=1 Tax=Alkanindiges illinoisensis TaxID=197183 RepID=UPI00047DC1E5|nr:protein TolR [Alkanindiges illinoisensis]